MSIPDNTRRAPAAFVLVGAGRPLLRDCRLLEQYTGLGRLSVVSRHPLTEQICRVDFLVRGGSAQPPDQALHEAAHGSSACQVEGLCVTSTLASNVLVRGGSAQPRTR